MAIEHLKSGRELAGLESQLDHVRAFEARIHLWARADWLANDPPDVTAVAFDTSKPIARLGIRTKGAEPRLVDLGTDCCTKSFTTRYAGYRADSSCSARSGKLALSGSTVRPRVDNASGVRGLGVDSINNA